MHLSLGIRRSVSSYGNHSWVGSGAEFLEFAAGAGGTIDLLGIDRVCRRLLRSGLGLPLPSSLSGTSTAVVPPGTRTRHVLSFIMACACHFFMQGVLERLEARQLLPIYVQKCKGLRG